jgi:hypothetical protein
MEAFITRKDESHGYAEEVPGRVAGTSDEDRVRGAAGPGSQSWGDQADRRWVYLLKRCEPLCPTPEIDGGHRPGVRTDEAARIAELERENRALRRANVILTSASAFFAAEIDCPHR